MSNGYKGIVDLLLVGHGIAKEDIYDVGTLESDDRITIVELRKHFSNTNGDGTICEGEGGLIGLFICNDDGTIDLEINDDNGNGYRGPIPQGTFNEWMDAVEYFAKYWNEGE